MIACVSPSLMVRSTPLRISLNPSEPPSSSDAATETCRSVISSVAMSVVSQVLVEVDQYVVPVDLHGVNRDRLGGRRTGGLAGPEVEARPVHPALDGAVVHVALGQRHSRVAALVLDREDLVVVLDHGDVEAIDLDPQRGAVDELAQGAGALEGHWPSRDAGAPVIRWTFFSSSTSTVLTSCSSSSGTPILRIRSLKKPCTTRRRASDSSIPRERRKNRWLSWNWPGADAGPG